MSQAERILRVLRNSDQPLKDSEIADKMDVTGANSIYHRLMDLHDNGKIEKIGQRPRKWVIADGVDVKNVDVPSGRSNNTKKSQLSLEKDVQRYLSGCLDDLESGLNIQSERAGLEVQVDSGRIDILAENSEGGLVVIEIKTGEAQRAVLGQIKAYMADIMAGTSETDTVKGIIIAEDFSQKLTRAITLEQNIDLFTYEIEFSFEEY